MADEKEPTAERKTLEQRHQMSDLDRLRHSCAHVLASAVLRIWPDAQLAGGPPVESGFYYDIDLDHSITPDDFVQIEAEMKKIVKENGVRPGTIKEFQAIADQLGLPRAELSSAMKVDTVV